MTTKAIKAAIYALSIIAAPLAADAALPVCPAGLNNKAVSLVANGPAEDAIGAFTYFLTEPTTNGAEVRVEIDPRTSSGTTDRLKIADPDGVFGKIGSLKEISVLLDRFSDDGARATVCLIGADR